MTDWNKELHIYLLDNINTITEEWLALRDFTGGSIYSKDAGTEAEQTLREQNNLTNHTIVSSLLSSKGDFEENKLKWAQLVAESRVASNTPLPDEIEALSWVRKVFYSQIKRFVEVREETIPSDAILTWGETINLAFDELVIAFTRTYSKLMNNRLSAQQSLINEIGTPIIKLNDSIGVLPLVGEIDTFRAMTLLEMVPKKCAEDTIAKLFIDLSGVSIIDTMVANQIYQVMRILGLLGIEVTFTGIRPEIAKTSVQLGLDFSNMTTFSSLQQALKKEHYTLTETD
ncbi:STAS domain-containing protein [Virgibacillus sp. C22-A2]|uniref:STAS domain-containing protein n=1 Tax=Virgibacillus tibetensis TaxID=3042313 RepID=A0ABU6KF80_9BACI|nr:STAS domain-containing protein [Virgibacillus sp. C22-A2]